MKTERELFEALPLAKVAIDSGFVYFNGETNSYWPNDDVCPPSAPESMNFAWGAWQAATHRDGFKFVPVEPTLKMAVAYEKNSIAPVSSLSVAGYKAMIGACDDN